MNRNLNDSQLVIKGAKYKIAVVVARFNEDITGGMLKGALETLVKSGVKESNIEVVWVPGAIEIPLACKRLVSKKKINGIIALGCVIKGDTDHYYYVSGESIRGVMNVMIDSEIPIGMGIITTNNLKQAKDRSGAKNNKGAEAAQAVLEMI